MLELIVPLDRVSLEVYGGHVDHGCIWSLVEVKISFSVRSWVSIFPSREVHPHSWVCRMGLVAIREGKMGDNSGSDVGLEGYGRSYIPVFQIRMERMKEVKRLPL
ncbi:hypothetical protein BHM03_00053639 [Ensete ventricosum]|nr:hypothetical protein BHM03_00053639 [Ensete ventricosum]